MVYDAKLNSRYLKLLGDAPGLSEKKMMGGACFFTKGNMIGGADRTKTGIARFMFRVGKDNDARAQALPGGEPMMRGKSRMRGFFFVSPDIDEQVLKAWMSLALTHAMSLPPKK